MRRYIWLCAFSLLAATGLDAASLRTLPDGYTRRVWQTQDGLPENTVQAFAQTPDHYLWIGTSGGLVRFDGARFVVFDRGNTPEIHENSIFCLTASRDGSLWAGTDGGGLVRYQKGIFRTYSGKEGLANNFVRAVYEDHEGSLWAGTDDGLFRLSGERFIELSASEYNARRAECEEGVQRLGKVLPGIRALRDVTLAELEKHRALLTDTIYRRCRHVISENGRVLEASSALQSGEVGTLGPLMADSHRSLRDDYQVSCAELDIMVEIASRQRGVYGARMTGGGFGGCTVNLVAAEDSPEFQRCVATEYKAATGLRPDIYICEASQGAEAVPFQTLLNAPDCAS